MASPLAFDPAIAATLFKSLDQIHLVYIHPNGIGVHGRDFGTDCEEALAACAKANADGYNIYWTVNRVAQHLHAKPAKHNMRAARFIHVDIDPPKSGGAFDKPAIAAAMLDIDAPPSFIIDSGGGLQAFWRLDGLAENLAAIEGINMQVRDYFEADACQNIDRLMRVPGSVNWPDKKKQMRGRVPRLATFISEDDGTVYAPEELAASFPPAKPSAANAPTLAAVNVPANITLITCDDLGLSALDPIRIAIEQPPGHDRSGDGLAAARIMANAGHADAQIIGALLNPANPVAAHFLAQRSPLRAASRAIQLVRADGPGEGETLHAPAMSQEDWDRFVANCKAKVNRAMVPAQLREPDPDEDIIATPRIGVPAWRRDLGDGAMAQFIDHVTSTAPSPQPWLTLGAALPMFGAAAGRRYAGPTNLRTNIYSIGIARSGGGKDRPLSASIDLMIAAGLANHVGSSKIASGSGLITAVTRNPSIYFPIDEIGFLIAAAANKNKAPKHIVEIMEILTEFYPRSNGRFLGTAYANDKERPREVIEQPNLCLFGVTTPRVFWGALSSANMEDGSLARMLIFETDNDYPDLQHNLIPKPIPDNLIEVVKAISDGADGHNPFPMGQGSAIVPKPYTVPYANAEAAALLIEMRNEQVDMNRRNENDIVSGVIARLAENTAKVALVKAITENPQSPTISVADLEWGMEIARKSVESLIKAARETVADSEHETMVKRVMKVIADAGSAGIDGTSLSRKTQFIDRRKRGDIIAGLIEAGMIRAMKMPKPTTGGPDKFVYFDIA